MRKTSVVQMKKDKGAGAGGGHEANKLGKTGHGMGWKCILENFNYYNFPICHLFILSLLKKTLRIGKVQVFSNGDNENDMGHYLLNAYYGADTILSILHLSTYLSLIKHL